MAAYAVYVHLPFCTVKCGYCDFNAYAGMDRLKPAYAEAVLAEIRSWGPALSGSEVSSIGFGGGTPGEFPPDGIGQIMNTIATIWPLAPTAEVSLEANPGTSGPAGLLALREAGVDRISFGAQSFVADELRFLDRIHSPEAIEASVRNARSASFRSVGLDLIYGLPGQGEQRWRKTLARTIALAPDHISCYALTVEPGTQLAARVARGDVAMPSGDAAAEQYEIACAVLEAAGFDHYELSNWARRGHRSRHNLAYWTDQPYLGVGAGAHGYVNGVRYENIAHPRAYVAAARRLKRRRDLTFSADGVITAVHRQSPEAAMVDFVALRLRLLEGLHLADFEEKFGLELETVAGRALAEGLAAGIVEVDCRRLRLTPRGLLLHGEFTARLMAVAEASC